MNWVGVAEPHYAKGIKNVPNGEIIGHFFRWDRPSTEIREWLQPRCRSYGEFEFWEFFFEDLTDMWKGLFDDMFSNDPRLWAHYRSADNSMDQHAGYTDRERFLLEAHERGYVHPDGYP